MENVLLIGGAGVLSGLLMSGIYAALREAVKRQKIAAEKTAKMVIEIEGLLRARR